MGEHSTEKDVAQILVEHADWRGTCCSGCGSNLSDDLPDFPTTSDYDAAHRFHVAAELAKVMDGDLRARIEAALVSPEFTYNPHATIRAALDREADHEPRPCGHPEDLCPSPGCCSDCGVGLAEHSPTRDLSPEVGDAS